MNTTQIPAVRAAVCAAVLASFVMAPAAQVPAKPQAANDASSASSASGASVTDPRAPVPPTVYQSVFQNTPKGVETESDNWRKANEEVGKFLRGHVDILKWEEAQAAKSRMEAKAAKPAVTPSAAKPTPASTSTPSPVEATKSPMPAGHKH